MTQVHNGSCLCGAVQFEVIGEFKKFFLCHCSRCRKTSGSAHCSNLFAPAAKVKWLSGEDKISHYRHPDTNFARNFCSSCSSLVPLHNVERDIVAVPAGSLDSEIDVSPQAHIFTDSKGNWDGILNDISCFEKMPN
ncbi:GFA family protein [Vibrio sp. RC27]